MRIEDLRDFRWKSEFEFEQNWIKSTYKLNYLNGLEVIVVPLADSELAAHVMLSFTFENSEPLLVSVEARREIGEQYSLTAGATRQFELAYVFGTESDLLALRILHRGDIVYSFPIKADRAFIEALLRELADTANSLVDTPKFYQTLRTNCTTTLFEHTNQVLDETLPWEKGILFPAKLGELLHRRKLVDTELGWSDAKQLFRLDERARVEAKRSGFSEALQKIRTTRIISPSAID
ncbi:DUF4105 domain-containing protein [Pelagicoccus albus]|uniref:DUF4105 domain-containing protein n=1 Tax=Pelagicoccus albus TaxID=415222 RepID=A0A7X1B904_9BACT|nr:DUF4105 domain-containing protein [Pelagicoccus albus]MBC2606598.1 DUF4105 domain-containing protein [Pelagicoccus albus]